MADFLERVMSLLGPGPWKERFQKVWDTVVTSYWAIPTVMMVGAVAVSRILLVLEEADWATTVTEGGWVYGGGPEGARQILSTIAGSMITIAGVVFSITVVVLTLASSQFGPRILRAFMDDRGNQLTLGTFTATFLYCILGLRVVDATQEDPFVPHLTVTTGVVLSLVSLGVLVYFIHHMAASIHASRVIERVGQELDRIAGRVFGEVVDGAGGAPAHGAGDGPVRGAGDAPADGAGLLPEGFDREARRVTALEAGYVLAVDEDALLEVAGERGLVVRVGKEVGEPVVEGGVLAWLWPEQAVDAAVEGRVRKAWVLGHSRTPMQDVLHPADQLAEIAVRALSPGINDPYTARTCVHRLGASLARLLPRRPPPAWRTDAGGTLRLVRRPVCFPDLLAAAFSPIRAHARGEVLVLSTLLSTLEELGRLARTDEQRNAVARQAAQVLEAVHETVALEADRALLEERYSHLATVSPGPEKGLRPRGGEAPGQTPAA